MYQHEQGLVSYVVFKSSDSTQFSRIEFPSFWLYRHFRPDSSFVWASRNLPGKAKQSIWGIR